MFRIDESVEVPGKTTDDKGNSVPGVVTAKVFADGTGEQYNIKPGRFTIPGLAGTDQFDAMYAESTDTFTGGFEGSKFIIDDAELQKAKQSVHLELRDALLKRLDAERPAGFIAYKGAVNFTYESLPSTQYGDELATIKEKAKLQVPIFKQSQFAAYLAKNTAPGYEGEDVLLDDPYALTFSYPVGTTTDVDLSKQSSIKFDLTGNVRIIWQFDSEKLKSDLAGLAKTALTSVLSGYPAIERAEAVVRPFWKKSFPSNPSDITINTVVGTEAKKQ